MLALDLVVAEKVDGQETLEMGTKHSTEVELEVEVGVSLGEAPPS